MDIGTMHKGDADMDHVFAQLKKLLGDIGEKTGVRVRLAPGGGEETAFPLEFCGRTQTAYLDGTGEEAARTAKLVHYLVANADARTFADRDEQLRSILLGEGSEWDTFRFITRCLAHNGACTALDVLPEKRPAEAFELIKGCIAESHDLVVRMDKSRLAVVRFSDDEQSAYDFGQFLWQSMYEELGVQASIGVGCEVSSFSEIALSYGQAVTAVRMGAMFRDTGEVHSYREYLLVKMLEDVPRTRLEEYMMQFRLKDIEEVFGDREMTATAEAFLECDLNISETSRRLYMHRNTLMYRLDKIERVTGLNIRKFSDAVTFRVLSVLYHLSQQQK